MKKITFTDKEKQLILDGLRTKQALMYSSVYYDKAQQHSQGCDCYSMEETFAKGKEIDELITKIKETEDTTIPDHMAKRERERGESNA